MKQERRGGLGVDSLQMPSLILVIVGGRHCPSGPFYRQTDRLNKWKKERKGQRNWEATRKLIIITLNLRASQ